ncbi:hypothetical protein Pse7367_1037 [Thalassoporum mexicanum PCC 7367]|uniref:cofactor assembly of complex C subunit B n=1 Tax=Thalassoporum mexicanum TaxID=3457544 RepID=UPI00029FC7A3|nr:cofactor assembly of complex C subunit B [Pseudanabaena sp. PCC 7367]AFY69335.1 hypothetical protein Pse7367_1037 [Pseudanabaena sp. PCC 7367]
MIRYLPLIVGIIGGTALFINRLLTPMLTESQSRSDAMGILESAILILIALLWQQVQPKPPESVQLVGAEVFEIDPSLTPNQQAELAWASHTLLTNTITKSIVIWYDDRILLRRGIMPKQDQSKSKNESKIEPGAILARSLKTQKPTYLVKLALYPGRLEFDYLPENTQGVIVQPIDERGAIILGANAPRSYTKQDENWIAAIAAKLAYSLSDQNDLVEQPNSIAQPEPRSADD